MLARTNPIEKSVQQNAAPVVNLIEDDPGVRRSIASLLSTIGLQTNAYPNAKEAIALIDVNQPGCMIIDMRLPDRDGLDLLEELREQGIALPAIIITGYADVPSAIRAMKLKVFDFLEKPFPEQQFIATVQSAINLDMARVSQDLSDGSIKSRIDQLSSREKDVLKGIFAGRSSKMIASDLGISPKTVENYRANLMYKLEADNVAHLITLVYEHMRAGSL